MLKCPLKSIHWASIFILLETKGVGNGIANSCWCVRLLPWIA
jgi:hypothetical protein